MVIDALLLDHKIAGLPTSEELFSRMNADFLSFGAQPQRGSDGRWSGRLYLPCPIPAGLNGAEARFKAMSSEQQNKIISDESHPDHHMYWWDFQRFVDMTPHPWGSSSWIWNVGNDPGVPVR